MKLRNVLGGMDYVGEVAATKRVYSVFSYGKGYILASNKTYSVWEGDFVIVPGRHVEYLAKRLKGQSALTTKAIKDRTRKASFARDRFNVLNGLYVLIALGRAKIDRRYKQRAIYFNVYG